MRWLSGLTLGLWVNAGPGAVVTPVDGGARLRLVVEDERGRPCALSEASVCLAREGRRQGECWKGLSDSTGGLRAERLLEGTFEVELRAQKFGGAWVPAVRLADGVETDLGTIRLSAHGRLLGRVITNDGAPIAYAMVGVERAGDASSEGRPVQALSDAEGAFALEAVPAGSVVLRATHPAFVAGVPTPAQVDPAEAPPYVEFRLSEGGRLVGRILSAAPAVSGSVEWNPLPLVGGRAPRVAKVDPEAGTFVLEHLPIGPAFVTWRAASGAAQRQVEVELLDGETTEVEFADWRILVGGRVTRAGAPLPNHSVTLLRAGSVPASLPAGDAPDGPHRLAAVTDEDGRYELVVDEPGSFLARVQDPGGHAVFAAREVEIPDTPSHTLDLEMPAAELRGVVVDEESRPIPGASVLLLGRSRDTRAGVSMTADLRGSFVASLAPGEYRVSAEAPGMIEGRTDVVVTEGITRVQVELDRGLALRGVVVDSTGRPARGVPVVVATPDLAGGSTRESTTDADGGFNIDGLDGLRFTIMAGVAATGFALDAGKLPSPPLRLQLQHPARVSLRVYESNGAPVVGAVVMVTEVNGQLAPAPAIGWSDGTGRVEIAVPEGSVALRVWKHARFATVVLQATAGAVVDGQVIVSE